MSTATTSSVSSSFQPATADWADPKTFGRCSRWLTAMEPLKKPLEDRTTRNIAFLEGRQDYSLLTADTSALLPTVTVARKPQLPIQYNVIRYLLLQRQAKMQRLDPAWSVPAYTADEFDQVVARFSNDVLAWYWTDGLRMPKRIAELLGWLDVSPVVFMHPHWNPCAGEPVPVTFDEFARPRLEGQPDDDYLIQQRADMQEFMGLHGFSADTGIVTQFTGDIDYDNVDIYRAMWYPFYASAWKNVHIFRKSDLLPEEDVVRRYNVPLEVVRKSLASSEDLSRYTNMLSMWSNPYMPSPQYDPAQYGSRMVLVHQIYVDDFLAPPRGASAVVLGSSDEAVLVGTLGNRFHQLPFRPMCGEPLPGRIYGTSIIDNLIVPQTEINLAKSQQAAWRNQMIRPRIIRDKQDGADDDAFKSENQDAVISVNDIQTKRPQILYEPSSGIEAEQAVAFSLRYMHDAAAIPDISLGRTEETGIRSGTGFRSLQNEVDQRMRVTGAQLDEGVSWSGSFFLGELQDKAVGARLIPLVGDNNSVEFRTWSRANLRPTVYDKMTANTAVVRVTAFSNIPTTPIDARNTLLALAQAGFVRPGQHDSVIARVFGMNDLRTTLDKGRADRGKQEREISVWRNGGIVGLPARTDNHLAHEDVLTSWVSSDEFQMLSAKLPAVAQDVLQHLEAHQQGKYDDAMREQYRQTYAALRVGAEFASRAVQAGVPQWAQAFIMQSAAMAAGVPGLGAPKDAQGAPSGAGTPSGGASGDKSFDGLEGSRAEEYADKGDASSWRRRTSPGIDGEGTSRTSAGA